MEQHTRLYRELLSRNSEDLFFIERSINDAEPVIYKVQCLPSTMSKYLTSAQTLSTARGVTVRVLYEDLVGLLDLTGVYEFCDVEDIQSRIEKASYRGQRYLIDELTVNGFGNLVTIVLNTED